MSKKRYLLIVFIFALLTTTFIYSYNWSMRKFKNNEYKSSKKTNILASEIDKLTANLNVNDEIPSDAKITLKTQYKKSGDVITTEGKGSDYAGKAKSELQNEGYIIEETSKNQFTLTKVMDSYLPNKYVLGVKGENYAIYKTDEDSEMTLVEETDIKIPSKGDYDLLIKGSSEFQFDNIQQAEEKLGEGI